MTLLRIAALLTILGLIFMVWSVLQPTPMPVMLAMSVGQGVGTLAFLMFLLVVIGDLRKAQVLTRFVLDRFWGPVGSTISEESEVKHVMGHLFAGEEGRKLIQDVDSHIAKLPGMEGLRIVEKSLDKRGIAAEGPGYVPAQRVAA